jgi:hypothetical protein
VRLDIRRVSIFADDWTPGKGIEIYLELFRLCACFNIGIKRR